MGKAFLGVVALLAIPATAWAGPPFMTDDPEPTDRGRWEIYGPMVEADGLGRDVSGASGVEINYGAAENLQITVGLPAAFSHDAGGWTWGRGDLRVSAKYRLYNKAGLQIAVFPGVSIPTARKGLGAGRMTGLAPIWVQKDFGRWSAFGGGGYAINPGPGNRNSWTGGLALANQVSERLLIGVKADRSGADTVGGKGSTSLGVGAILKLKPPFRLLASAGPTWEDHRASAGFHAFAALGVDF